MAAMTVVAMMPLVVGPRVMISAVLRRARKSRASAQPHVPAGAENRRPATPVRNATTVMIVMIVVRAVRPTRDADAMLPVERLVLTNPVAADLPTPMPEMVVAVTMPETDVAVMAVETVGEIVAEMALDAMAPEILVAETVETAIAVRAAQVHAVVPADGAAMPVMADATVADATLETVTGVHAAPAHVALAHGAVLPVMVGAILDVAVLVIVPVTAAGAMVPGSRAVAASRVANQPVVQAIAQAPRAASPQATAHAARRTNRTCGL